MMAFRRQLIWLFGAALLLRLLYVGAGVEVAPQDTPDYDEIARNLLAGNGFVASSNWFGHELRAWRAPLYPVFLAAVYGVTGYGVTGNRPDTGDPTAGHTAVRIVQAVLGALTVVLIYLLGRQLWPPIAPVAGWLAACYEPLIASANEVMTEVLFTALFIAGLTVVVKARQATGYGWRWPLAAGALLGLAALARPVGLLAVPAVLLVTAWEDLRRRQGQGQSQDESQRQWRRWAWFSSCLGAGLVVVLLPWTVRNAIELKAFVPLSTHGGFIVARSNADVPDWRIPHGWRIDERTFVDVPGEIARDRRWRAQGIDWIRTNPGRWLVLSGERLLRFLYVFRPDYNAAFVFMLPLALMGMRLRGAAPGYRYLSATLAISVLVFCLLLYGSTRFRLPLEPLLLLFAAAAGVEGWRRWGQPFALIVGAWGLANASLRLFDESARQAVVAMLRAGGLK